MQKPLSKRSFTIFLSDQSFKPTFKNLIFFLKDINDLERPSQFSGRILIQDLLNHSLIFGGLIGYADQDICVIEYHKTKYRAKEIKEPINAYFSK